jgi:2'-5' RNA ligase
MEELGQLGRAVRPVGGEHLHLTLRFLGEVPVDLLASIAEAMSLATADVPGFELQLSSLGVFPSAHRPHSVWVGVAANPALADIVGRLGERLLQLNIPVDDRPWTGHITLARVKAKPPPALSELLASHRETLFGSVPVDAVHLMLSELRPEGPRYTVADAVKLTK